MQDTFGTICFPEFMSEFELRLKQHLGDQYHELSWRERMSDVINGSRSISFKLAWLHSQYDQCKSYPPFTTEWWQHVPTPLRLKFLGSSTQNIASEARGCELPNDFTGTLVHYTLQRHVPSITRWGLLCGRKCGKSGETCIYLAACDFNSEEYTAATRRLGTGDLKLLCVIGFPPDETQDVRIYVNYERLCRAHPGPLLRQAENFAISCANWFADLRHIAVSYLADVELDDRCFISVHRDFEIVHWWCDQSRQLVLMIALCTEATPPLRGV